MDLPLLTLTIPDWYNGDLVFKIVVWAGLSVMLFGALVSLSKGDNVTKKHMVAAVLSSAVVFSFIFGIVEIL